MVASSQPNLPTGSTSRRKQRRHVSIEDDPGQRKGSQPILSPDLLPTVQRTVVAGDVQGAAGGEDAASGEGAAGGEGAAAEVEHQVEEAATGGDPGDERAPTDLSERALPLVPEPSFAPSANPDPSGWDSIDRVGGWNALLTEFTTMEEIPQQHKQAWTWAWSEVLHRVMSAQEGKELDRALMWLCFLPQALLRQSKRGGRQGRGEVAMRFNAVSVDRNWGLLVSLWERDMRKLKLEEAKVRPKKVLNPEEELDRKRRAAKKLLAEGQVSRAVARINSFGVADMSDPSVREQLKAKYPDSQRAMPANLSKSAPVEHLRGLRENLLSLDRTISPGTGGLRPDYLTTLAQLMEAEQMAMLEGFGLRYANGDLPHWFYRVWLSVCTVPIFKTDERDSIRPLGIRNPLLKAIHKEIMLDNRQAFTQYLEPQQLVLSVGGGAKLVFSVRLMLETRREFCCVKNDFRNAYNEIERNCIVEALSEEPTLKHLSWHAAVTLAPHHGLESGGRRWGSSPRGTTQGSTEASAYFCAGWHKELRKLDDRLKRDGGMAKAGADDLYAVGRPEVVFPALEEFWEEVRTKTGLSLQRAKTEAFAWPGVELPGMPEGLSRAGETINQTFEDGFILYGVPIGTDIYVKHALDKKVDEIQQEACRAVDVLSSERQCLWTVLRSSVLAQFEYWLMMVHPSQVMEAARRMDSVIWMVLEKVAGFSIPREDEGLGWENCLDIPVTQLTGRSFQSWVGGLPIRLGGLGLRCQEELAPLAYLGALEQALPFFGGEDGICPQLSHLVGESALDRWRPLIQSGCRTGNELMALWENQQHLMRQCYSFLGEEMEGPFASPVEGVGDGSVDGSSRKRLGEVREQVFARVMKRGLLLYPDQSTCPVSSWKERDKLSTAFLLSLPGPHYGIQAPVFSEALATLLCAPSPMCSTRLGQPIGKSRVDKFGHRVINERLEGSHWTHRHDFIKAEVNSLCAYTGLPAVCEAYGVFSNLIPQQPLNRLERHRERQILRPDFIFQIPDEVTGVMRKRVADVKTIGLGAVSYYHGGAEGMRAVERRSRRIQAEYEAGARKGDEMAGAIAGQGRVSQKLSELGPVLDITTGGYFEGSDGLHKLIKIMGDSWSRKQVLATGRPPGEGQLSTTIGLLRKRISTAIVKANISVLLDRSSMIGEGALVARGRREWTRLEERRMRDERQAAWRADTTGRAVVRKGHFWLG